MQVKDETVNVWGLELCMQKALRLADEIWDDYGQELVITSARDGMHSAGSLHYYGRAIDCRTKYFSEEDKKRVFEELQADLGADYDVIWHTSHIHIEYDKE